MTKHTLLIQILLAVLLILAEEPAQACRASRDLKHSFVMNFEEQPPIRVYGEGAGSTLLPQMIDKCTESAGKFLMLSKGVFMPTLVSDVADISLDGEIPNDRVCRIKDPIFTRPLDHDQKKDLVRRQHRFLQECAFISVAELNGRPLRYNSQQKFCRVKPLGPSLVQMEGDYCFLNINPSYNLAITMGLKPECATLDTMKRLGLEFGDVEAALNSYVTGDATGMSTEVDPVGSSRYRFTLQTPAARLPLSEDLGAEAPRFPSTYEAEMNLADLQFRPAGSERVDLDMYLSVDNMASLHCEKGLCVSPSAYNIPVAAEVELFHLEASGKSQWIDGWTTASIAQGNWKGLMRMPQQSLDGLQFQPGSRYKVVVNMIDPYDDFYIFLHRTEQFLVDLKGVNGVAGLDAIPSLEALSHLTGLPSLQGLPGMTAGDLNSDLEASLSFFKKLGATRLWPTYYSTLCDPSHGRCFPAGKQKFWNRLTAEFTIGELSTEQTYELKDIRMIKEAPHGVVMNRLVPALPRYTCEP